MSIGFPLRCIGTPRPEIRRRVGEAARLLRIDHLLESPVGRLAAGDRQRVALGRAIVRRPKAFLMDEPLGTLDAGFRELMCEELRALHDRVGATTVYVTHDQVEAMAMADRIAVMDKGEILQAGPPAEVYHRPASLFVAGFVGSPAMNFLACEGGLAAGTDAVRFCGASVRIPRLRADAPQERLVLGARPEHVRLDDASPVRGEVYGVEYMGARQIVTVDTEAGRLRLRTGNQVPARIGERVGLALDPERVILFDPASGRALPSDLVPVAEAARDG